MLTKIIKTIEKNAMLSAGDTVLCALSGGVDSSVLLDALLRCSKALGITVKAAHLNHMLRGADADADEGFVAKKCRDCGVEFICERCDVAAFAAENGMSAELAARRVRYDFLRRAKEELGASKIATAHNANDNLETIIFNLSRGSGSDGLCGIPPVRGDIIRPLIEITRAEIERYADEEGIAFCVDKTNLETVYTRNKIRHNIIPQVLKVNSAAVENASRSSEILRAESELLKKLACDEAERIRIGDSVCSREELGKTDPALFGRVCESFARNALGDDGFTLEYRHICDIRSILKSDSPSKSLDLPCGLRVRCEYEKLVFEKRENAKKTAPIVIREGCFEYGKYTVFIKKTEKCGKIHNSVNTFFIPCDRIEGELVLRSRREGDEIKLLRRPKKSLKKLFIDERVPKTERDLIPVIADDEKVFAVYGFGSDERFLPGENTENFSIEMRYGEIEE